MYEFRNAGDTPGPNDIPLLPWQGADMPQLSPEHDLAITASDTRRATPLPETNDADADTAGDEQPPTEQAADSQEQVALNQRDRYAERFRQVAGSLQTLDKAGVETVVTSLAANLHHNWRQGYILTHRTGDGPDDYKPRWKPVGDDQPWMERLKTDPELQRLFRVNPQDGTAEVDIAHATAEQLPENPWKIENTAAARLAATELHEAVAAGTATDDNLLELLSDRVNRAWKTRHPEVFEPAADPEEEQIRVSQRLDYHHDRFPEFERNKDREHVVLAAEHYAEQVRRTAG